MQKKNNNKKKLLFTHTVPLAVVPGPVILLHGVPPLKTGRPQSHRFNQKGGGRASKKSKKKKTRSMLFSWQPT